MQCQTRAPTRGFRSHNSLSPFAVEPLIDFFPFCPRPPLRPPLLPSVERSMASTSHSQTDPAAQDGEELELSSEEEQQQELERELADVPFEEIQRARADGSHSARLKPAPQHKVGRANKNRPMEISSKTHVGKFREVIQTPKKLVKNYGGYLLQLSQFLSPLAPLLYSSSNGNDLGDWYPDMVVRDPRFESVNGTLDTEGFRRRYNFLYEVELPAEKEKLQKLINKSKDPNAIEELKNHISWIDKQLKSDSHKKSGSKILSEHIKKEREAVNRGKRPYYLKKSEIRKRELAEKFNKLKDAGKLESFMEKRRKKNASKDHRYMPYRRSSDSAK